MNLIYSKKKPVEKDSEFADTFVKLLSKSNRLELATGYISEDSLLFLEENINHLNMQRCELLIGMHAFDGFTKSQFDISKKLCEYLQKNNLGSVYVCLAFPYHGKFFNFFKDEHHIGSITGSANITQIIPSRQRNLTVCINESAALFEMRSYFAQLKTACKEILEYTPETFKDYTSLLQDCIGVEQLNIELLNKLRGRKSGVVFELPLKPEAKSNLNIFFGKGRQTSNGVIKPRSWFEFEIIVPSSTTSKIGYPKYSRFTIVTDDGWKFECSTQGDYSKNFRSTDGLAILGMWVKGRMINSGVVKAGDFITSENLLDFGHKNLLLFGTDDPNTWLLEFKKE